MVFPHCPCLSCSLFLAFLSLACMKCVLVHGFSPSPMFVLLTFSCLLVSSFLMERFGIRAFLKHGTVVNPNHFQGHG
ncbi:hypothetical protein B0H14DRAFT_2768330 [Mycena olivaceomarginata]|nr:hypothetical protein B0H14DRAFT_2768330 [Mycena olivaceomarginata]